MNHFVNVVHPEQAHKTYRCPCCGFKTLYGRGQDEICPVCFWQDDGQDGHDESEIRGGPNRNLSLTVARANFKRCGACEDRFAEDVRQPLADEH